MVSCDSYDQSLSMNDEDSNDAADQTSSDDSRQILIESSYFGQPNETNNKISAIPRLKTNLYCMQMASREECAKQIYGRKIALDACLVGELKAPNWRQNSSGYAKISVPPCTFTTASGGSGMKMYPYSTQTSCGCTLLSQNEHHNSRRRIVCSRCRSHRTSSSMFPLTVPPRSILASQIQPASTHLHSSAYNQQAAHQHSGLAASQQQQHSSTPSSFFTQSSCDNESSTCPSILAKSIRLHGHHLSSFINHQPPHQVALVPHSQPQFQNSVALFQNQHSLRQCRETSFSMPALRGFEMYAHLLRDIHIR